jgi:hypothetical protein
MELEYFGKRKMSKEKPRKEGVLWDKPQTYSIHFTYEEDEL